MGAESLELRAYRVWHLGSGCWGLWLRAWGSGILGFGVLSFKLRVQIGAATQAVFEEGNGGCVRFLLLGGSGGLRKWVSSGDKQGYYMGYRGY